MIRDHVIKGGTDTSVNEHERFAAGLWSDALGDHAMR
jgi:hypothetical protein